MFLYDYIGKTLNDVAHDMNWYSKNGVCIFLLSNENDSTGKQVAESFSVRDILKRKPHLADKKIKLVNNFYGEVVFRVI